ncbi:MAG: hypothetical protein ACLFSE_08390 [Spirochaetia bacterium]
MKKTILTPEDGWIFTLSGRKSAAREELEAVYPGDTRTIKIFPVAGFGKERFVFCADQHGAGRSGSLFLPSKGILRAAGKGKKPFSAPGKHVWIITKDHIESYHLSKREGLAAGVTRREEEGWAGIVVFFQAFGSDKAVPVICAGGIPKTILRRSRLSLPSRNSWGRIFLTVFLLLILGLLHVRIRILSRLRPGHAEPEIICPVSGVPFRHDSQDKIISTESVAEWLPADSIVRIGNQLNGECTIRELSVSKHDFSIILRTADPLSLIERFGNGPGTAGISYRKEGDTYVISAGGAW